MSDAIEAMLAKRQAERAQMVAQGADAAALSTFDTATSDFELMFVERTPVLQPNATARMLSSGIDAAKAIPQAIYKGVADTWDKSRLLGERINSLRVNGNAQPNSDTLEQINSRLQARELRTSPYRENSPMAFGAGEFIGEGIAVSPYGATGGFVGRKVGQLGYKAFGRNAQRMSQTGETYKDVFGIRAIRNAGEGFGIGFGLSDEDTWSGAAKDGAFGAAFGLGPGTALDSAIHGTAKWLQAGALRGGQMIRTRGALNDAQARATENIRLAREQGGFTLDSLTATQTQEAAFLVQNLRSSGETSARWVDFKATQDTDMTNFLQEKFIVPMSRVYFGLDAQLKGQLPRQLSQEGFAVEAGNAVQTGLHYLSTLDRGKFKELYNAFDKEASNVGYSLDVQPMINAIKEWRTSDAVVKRAEADTYIKQIDSIFGRYGIDIIPQADAGRYQTIQTTLTSGAQGRNTSRTIVEDRPQITNQQELAVNELGFPTLKLSELSDVIQQLNGLYNSKTDNNTLNTFSRGAVTSIYKFLDDAKALVDTPEHRGLIDVYQRAITARSAWDDNWSNTDIIRRIIRQDGEGNFTYNYENMMQRLNVRDLKIIKDRLAGEQQNRIRESGALQPDSEGLQRLDGDPWASIQLAPILSSLEAAMVTPQRGGPFDAGIDFDPKLFANNMNKFLTRNETNSGLDAYTVLYGEVVGKI